MMMRGEKELDSSSNWWITIEKVDVATYGRGIGIGSGRRIFFPPLRRRAATAAFLSIFFFPASAPFGTKAAITMATTAKMANSLK